jgi:flavin reductase (DIM6/NTAB) family NADH-FMN oxidoreductase RutF
MVGQPMYRMVTRGYPQGVVVATSPGVGGAPNAATVAGAMSSSSPILMLAAAVILILVLRK